MIALSKNPGLKNLRFLADPDSTFITTFGGTETATSAIRGFVDVGAGIEPEQFFPTPIESPKPPLLEVADGIAYISRRALSSKKTDGSPNAKRLASLYEAIGPQLVEFSTTPDGALGFRVPNTTLRKGAQEGTGG